MNVSIAVGGHDDLGKRATAAGRISPGGRCESHRRDTEIPAKPYEMKKVKKKSTVSISLRFIN